MTGVFQPMHVFAFDIETIPLVILLLQTGYLTIQSSGKRGSVTTYTLNYPNQEVRQSFNDRLAEIAVSKTTKNATYEAIDEALKDVEEGADIIMIKPGMPYLDIVSKIRELITQPIAVYQVSDEYAMLKAAAQNGWLDNDKVLIESLTSFKRAGADLIFTYAAPEVAKLLNR